MTELDNTMIRQEDHLLPETKQNLLKSSMWAKVIAIINMAMAGLMLIMMITAISSIASTSYYMDEFEAIGAIVGIVFMFIIMIGCILVPMIFLYKFSSLTKETLSGEDPVNLKKAIANLRNYFLVMGILSITGAAFMTISMFVFMGALGSM